MMLGKQINRAGSFSMLHAVALVGALALATWMQPAVNHAAILEAPKLPEAAHSEVSGTYEVFRATLIRILEGGGSSKGVET